MPEKKHGWKTKVLSHLPTIVLIYCLIQPILDVAGYWQVQFGISNTVTTLIRMLLLGGSVLLGFFLSDRKWIYLVMLAVLAVFTGLHAAAHIPGGYPDAVLDILNLIRIYLMPMTAICFITFLRQGKEPVFAAIKRAMFINLILIALVQMISTLTGTDPHTYSVDSTGILGWFMWTNSQSAILSMICPVAICLALRRWPDRYLPLALVTAIGEATLYVLAPRLAYFSLVAAGLGIAICLLIMRRKMWKKAIVIALVTILFIAAYPVSPTHSRLSSVDVRAAEAEQEVAKQNITKPKRKKVKSKNSNKETTVVLLDASTAKKMDKLYRSLDMWSMIDRFGKEAVFEAYDYTLDAKILANTRQKKIVFCQLLMNESGTMAHLFGLNLHDMQVPRIGSDGNEVIDNYDVENDYHGIYFLTGSVGLVLLAIFLLYFGLRALFAVLRKPKIYYNLEMISFAIAYVLALLQAYFTASVLRRNNASVYLAIVLAVLWYLSRKEISQKETLHKETVLEEIARTELTQEAMPS